MKLLGNFIEGITQTVRFPHYSRIFYLSRPSRKKLQKMKLIIICQKLQRRWLYFLPFWEDLLRHTHHRMTTGMGILNIENRIIFGLLKNLLKVKIKLGITFSTNHHKSIRILSHLINNVLDFNKVPCTLRHFKRDSPIGKTHYLRKNNI